MIFGSLNIASSALKAQQRAMDVVSHNIANVNTAGYSRQAADLVTLSPEQRGQLDFGRGVNVSNIGRSVDPVIDKALLRNGPQQAFWTNIQSGLNSIESTFGSLQSTGLSAAMDNFFSAAQQMANAPQDLAQKLNMRNKSEV
ncbi:MAG: flagellar basal body protein, partial [Mariprofundaceae bacterium]